MLFAAVSSAAPFARWFESVTPDGRTIRVYGEGDEFSAWFESEDGHAVRYSFALDGYEYLRRQSDGSLTGTGITVGAEAGHESELAAIPLHERDISEAGRRDRESRIRKWEDRLRIRERWKRVKAVSAARERQKGKGPLKVAPQSTTTGTIVGCTLLVDFPLTVDGQGSLWEQQSGTVTVERVERYLNGGPGVKEFGNELSVRQYYREMSSGTLDYTNVVIGPVKVPHMRNYYDNDDTCDVAGPRLIADAVAAMQARPDFDSVIAPKLATLTLGTNNVLALNVIFAGPEAKHWGYGLWAHSYECILPAGIDGVYFGNYQITFCGTELGLYAFCHENGHMICEFPDFYSYNDIKHGLVGVRCLMCDRTDDNNPGPISAYLRYKAGWLTPRSLPASGMVSVSRDYGDVYKYANSNEPEEYYLIENRGGGRDDAMTGKGIIIWHCYESGDNMFLVGRNPNFADSGDLSSQRLYVVELTMEQADGCYHMERNQGSDVNDFWFAGNTASGYCGEFSDRVLPTARWMDGSESHLTLRRFSSIGEVMTFKVGEPAAGMMMFVR